ncbi:PAS domain S-box protein [Aliamphritea spongicola]|nr:PAS domain S-box protein [Aliamphritea spongicola]
MSSDVKLTQNQSCEMDASILSYIDDLVSVVDKNYRYRAVSKGYETFFGCEHSQIIGKHISEVHGEAVFEAHIKAEIDRTLRGEEHTFRFWRPDSRGELRFLDVKHTCYRGPLTEGPGVAVVVRDVTEIVRAKEATEQKQELLNTIINAIPDLIFAKDHHGVYQVCNKSFEEFLGFSAENIIGKTDYELMSAESAAYINRRDKEVRQSHEAQRYDEWVKYQDGRRRLLDMYKLPLLEKDRPEAGVLGIGRNVTYERKAEQNLLMASLVFDTTLTRASFSITKAVSFPVMRRLLSALISLKVIIKSWILMTCSIVPLWQDWILMLCLAIPAAGMVKFVPVVKTIAYWRQLILFRGSLSN